MNDIIKFSCGRKENWRPKISIAAGNKSTTPKKIQTTEIKIKFGRKKLSATENKYNNSNNTENSRWKFNSVRKKMFGDRIKFYCGRKTFCKTRKKL